ncbi:MAG TPA: FAD-binding oxidoreductase [Flavobacterium sp.]|jgi:glycine/D-amino acid oxidase-like deaminating enzyme
MTDYLIIGAGLAGIAFAEKALQNNRSILIYNSHKFSASRVAAGIYNPVVVKRLSVVADAHQHLESMNSFYDALDDKLQSTFRRPMPLLRRFHSPEEQNNWFGALDKIPLSDFLSADIVNDKFNGLSSPYNFGKVLFTGYVDTKHLLNSYHLYLAESQLSIEQDFNFPGLTITPEAVFYNGRQARNIIFAEGFGLKDNPYFNYLPLNGTKGELLTIFAPALELDQIINTGIFILPLGKGMFKVGATYNWTDKSDIPTTQALLELEDKLREVITCGYEIIDHSAGVRPTVRDRKPLIGTHHEFKNLHVLNGLGTRGVMLAPAMANALFDAIEYKKPLAREIDIRRYDSLLPADFS